MAEAGHVSAGGGRQRAALTIVCARAWPRIPHPQGRPVPVLDAPPKTRSIHIDGGIHRGLSTPGNEPITYYMLWFGAVIGYASATTFLGV